MLNPIISELRKINNSWHTDCSLLIAELIKVIAVLKWLDRENKIEL